MIKTAHKYISATGFAILIVLVLSHVPTMGIDFSLLYPAGQAVWNFQDPYSVIPGFFNPPWMLVILAPIALLELQTARWVWFALGLTCYLIAFKRCNYPIGTLCSCYLAPSCTMTWA